MQYYWTRSFQAKVVGIDSLTPSAQVYLVSISSPSSEGGGNIIIEAFEADQVSISSPSSEGGGETALRDMDYITRFH